MSYLTTEVAREHHSARLLEVEQSRRAESAASAQRLQRRAQRLSRKAERVHRRAEQAAARARRAVARVI